MQFEELDVDMQQIILECQNDFIRDGQERLGKMDAGIRDWQAGNLQTKDVAELLLQHAHSMKGVARTIYFEDFHEQSEKTTNWIRERLDQAWDDDAARALIDHAANLHAAFAFCVQEVNARA